MGRDDGLEKPHSLIEVRPYHPDDLIALLDAWEAASRLAHPFMSDEFIAEQRISVAQKYLPNTVTDIALIGGKLVGFISMMGNEVGAIFVDPAYHHKGVGRALLDIPAAIHESLEVEVFEKNPIGRPFYERNGFKEISRSTFEPLGEVVIRMRLSHRD
ncbi:GNAT family N-acetyltransferase [Hyphococcus sp.]|uniref:GNAT family N-acetyltransferase n=1 Tax=Hyphococcus sp. TaxID=2038636 RepID=UPI002085B651|nr:MAG: acetyltransferase [Marinicaulis sp.]